MTSTAKRAARAVADLSQGTIIAVVEIEGAPERVFRALTDPEQLVAWWGSPDTYQITEWKADVRVGGAWRSDGKGADGAPFTVGGEFLEIDPPRRLVQTWNAAWDGGNTTTIRYQLDPIASGTRVTVRHEGFAGRPDSCAGHTAGWERVLDWLSSYLTGPEVAPSPTAAAPLSYFVCRLLPPRPTFAQDMNEAEASVMQKHAVYWAALAKRGVAVLFGPVADPQGVWGLGIVEVGSEDDVRTLEAGDPAILSGRGFRYEVLPMIKTVTRW